MNPIAACAQDALRRSPHPALRLRELVELVAERVDRTLDATRLRAVLETYPERFRVLDPWRGAWRLRPASGAPAPSCAEAWVVVLGDADEEEHPAERATLKLRESVRWLGRGVDGRSASEVSRWYAIVLAERSVRSAVARRAA